MPYNEIIGVSVKQPQGVVRDAILAEGGEAIAIRFDATQHRDSTRLVAEAVARFDRLDVAVIGPA